MRPFALTLALACLAGCGSAAPEMRLRRVVLYQNGVGYFERSGRVEGGEVTLRLASHEIDDVLTTLTVVEQGDPSGESPSPSAIVPEPTDDEDAVRVLTLSLNDDRPRELLVAYAAPTPVWRTTYRVVLDDDGEAALLQAWAVVYNASPEDWTDVELALATAAPFSFRVDLRDRRFAERPNVTDQLGGPSNTGAVFASSARAADRDQDRILDEDDACPNEPETYNGVEDEDGCPDRGSIAIEESHIAILDKIYFETGASEILQRSDPIVDAIAATLDGNPHITRVTVAGHASDDEAHAWALSAERAGAVRAALIERGVDGDRLVVQAFGATQELDARDTADARARNRRVELEITATDDGAPREGVRAEGVERAGGAAGPTSIDQGGGTRYGLARHVSVPAGSSALVTVLNERVPGAAILLFRPDPRVPGSATHPMRAARVVNDRDIDLVRGPVSLFAGGELLGEGLLDALPAGRTAFVPYGLDGATDVEHSAQAQETPARILALDDGVLTVERTRTLRTRYAVLPGRHAPSHLYVHHRIAAGHEPVDPPPGSQPAGDALIVPLPIVAERRSELTLVERRPVTGRVSLLTDFDVEIEPFLAGSSLSDDQAARLRRLVEDRERARDLVVREQVLRRDLADAAMRNGEVRRSLSALGDRPRVETARRLRRELTERLDSGVERVEQIASELATLSAQRQTVLSSLRDAIRDFEIEPATDAE